MNKLKQNLRKSTRARQTRSQKAIEKSNKAISSISSNLNSRYTSDPLQDQENKLSGSTAFHQKGRPQTTTRLSLRLNAMTANSPSSDATCPINSSGSPANYCSNISTNPAKRTSDNIQTVAPRKSGRAKVLDQPDVPAKQWVRKPDSQVSATEKARRIKKEKKLAGRKRDKEAKEKRLLVLRKNGVDRRPGPCFDCADRNLRCIVPPVPDPNPKRNKCLECYKSNGRRTCGDRVQELQPAVPTHTLSAHREKVLNRHLLVDVGGQYYSEQLKNWFKQLLKDARNKQLAEWIDSSLPGVESGELAERPCYPCAKTGSICRKIKIGSLAWKLSPKTTRCSTCLKPKNHLPECRSCRLVTDEEWYEIQLERTTVNSTSLTRIPATDCQLDQLVQQTANFLSESQTTKIPLKGAHEISEAMNVPGKPTDWRNQTLLEFRRKSASAIQFQNLQLLEGGLSGLEDLGTQMEKMYESIRHLSNSSVRLGFESSWSPMPFKPSNIETFANLGASKPAPTIMSSIGKLINISPGSSTEQYYTRIDELGISTLSLRKVVCAVASMTLWDLAFQDDPFNFDARLASVMRVFENETNNHAKIGQRLELYHMSRLEMEEEFRNNLKTSGEKAGQKLWEILKPLLLLNLAKVSKDAVEDLRQQCSEITRIASQLNAHLKAKYIAPRTFWPIPGQAFDKSLMIFMAEAASSTVQTVRIPLCFGILTESPFSAPSVQAKSVVDAVM